jgi:hypothetical protein
MLTSFFILVVVACCTSRKLELSLSTRDMSNLGVASLLAFSCAIVAMFTDII